MDTSEVRFGIIGVGVMGRSHARRFSSNDLPARLVAVADVDPLAREAAEREFNVEALTTSTQLLERDDIDAVIITTPSGTHAEPTVEALEAGKHVFLEKPIEVTTEAAAPIIAAERRSGKLLTIASPRRFASQNLFIRRMLDAGQFGRVTTATVESPFWRSQEYYDSAGWRGTWQFDGGGALMNQGVHLVDLALWFLGDVEEVYAHTGLLAHQRIEVEDTVTVTARMANGALMTLMATTAAYDGFPVRLALTGDAGSIVTEGDGVIRYAAADGSELPELADRDIDGQAMAQLVDFVEAIRTNGRPLVSSSEGLAAVAFVEAVYESGRTGKPVSLARPGAQ